MDTESKLAGPFNAEANSSVSGLVLAHLSDIRTQPPAKALAAADAQRSVLTDPLLQAVERGLSDPIGNFETEGLLFNHATYLLAKWREKRAYPLFIRWFSLPGELAFDLGGDTVPAAGSRLLASVCGEDLEPLRILILNREANWVCRGEAMQAIAVLSTWGEIPRPEVEEYLLLLAREKLERQPSDIWNVLARLCVEIEAVRIFPELKRACDEGLIANSTLTVQKLEELEQRPRGRLWDGFAKAHLPITDISAETRHWSGYQQEPAETQERIVGDPGATYLAPAKAARNEPCPCGSGKKFKKCCGS